MKEKTIGALLGVLIAALVIRLFLCLADGTATKEEARQFKDVEPPEVVWR